MKTNAIKLDDQTQTVGLVEGPSNSNSKAIVTILSTMRSGSTLLKALLAEADDVSNLPEVNFQRFQNENARSEIEQLDSASRLVLKRPAWFHEAASYPRLPNISGARSIVLVRDCYETVKSLKKMVFRKAHVFLGVFANRWLVDYWTKVVANIHELAQQEHAISVRYEDLVADPIPQTATLFEFIGSSRTTGVDSYQVPRDYDWKWGRDDGGPRIKSLRVLPPIPHGYEDQRLLKTITNSEATMELRSVLGYDALPF